ncbi:MAG: DNA replication and repair protein RecF [Acidobacteria bacterium]|nr:DNA replication and repair protein RecF [Acidobacteriota bacterium]
MTAVPAPVLAGSDSPHGPRPSVPGIPLRTQGDDAAAPERGKGSVQSLSSTGFRNLQLTRHALHPRLNLIAGPNGQGKTNVLEALALVSGRVSFRTSELLDTLAPGHREAAITVGTEAGVLAASLVEGKRAQLLEGRRITRAVAARHLPIVFLTGSDLTRLAGGPADRRRALDRLAAVLVPGYTAAYSRYEKARASRNRLLSGRRSPDADELSVYEDALAQSGASLVAGRRAAAARLSPALSREAAHLSSPYAPLVLSVQNDLGSLPESAVEAELRSRFLEGRSRERAAGRTLTGPHRDDVLLLADGNLDVATRASAGESRTLLLAWTLAEVALLTEALSRTPVLAFDDFDSEWDRTALAHFAEALPLDGQILLTSARPETVQSLPLGDGLLHRMEKGRITGTEALGAIRSRRLYSV